MRWPKKSRQTRSNGTTVWPLYCAISKNKVDAVWFRSSDIRLSLAICWARSYRSARPRFRLRLQSLRTALR